MNRNPDLAKLRSFTLERIPLAMQTVLPGAVARHVQFEAQWAINMDALLTRFTAHIAGQAVPEVDETFPATWLDAVKDRWVPNWARRWVPVNYRHISVTKLTLVPSFIWPGHDTVVTVDLRDNSYLDYGDEDEDT